MRDLYDLPPAMFGRRIGLDIKGQHVRTEDLLDPAVTAYWQKRGTRDKAA